jgi:hypothetical protein
MATFECDVAGPICLVLFLVPDKDYTLCNVANDGRLNVDGLDRCKSVTVRGRAEQHTPLWHR